MTQEPIAYVMGYYNGRCIAQPYNTATILPTNMALYAGPEQREWVGLTDEERDQFYKYVTMPDLVKAIEQALKEKNNG
jgi:hypothetical protein